MTLIAVPLMILLSGAPAIRAIAEPASARESPLGERALGARTRPGNVVVVIRVVRPPAPPPIDPDPNYLGIVGVDTKGRPLDGKHRYLVHFAKGAVPPAKTRWSLTALETDPFRSATHDRDGILGHGGSLRYNPDRSLDVYLQHRPPGPGPKGNWLRTPPGPFNLILNVRSPGGTVAESEWKAPTLERLD